MICGLYPNAIAVLSFVVGTGIDLEAVASDRKGSIIRITYAGGKGIGKGIARIRISGGEGAYNSISCYVFGKGICRQG